MSIGAAAHAQDTLYLDPNGAPENRVFLVSTRVTEEANAYMHSISPRVGRTALISNEFIDPDQNLVPNWSILNHAIQNECEPDYDGVIVLNWEGPFFATLKKGPGPDNPNFYIVRQRAINLINYVRNRRPNAKIGMYAIPSGKWNVDHAELMPIYDILDVMMPGGVIADADPEKYDKMVEKLKKNVEFALQIAGNRPVLAFHSPRHTHSGSILIEKQLWASHISKTFEYEYEGRHAAGVIIWDPTIHMYYQNELYAADAPYLTPEMDVWAYISGLEMAYYCTGAKAMIDDANCMLGTELLGDLVDALSFLPPPDGVINAADLAFLLTQWGANPGSPADFVSSTTLQPPPDGVVDASDLAILLGNWSH